MLELNNMKEKIILIGGTFNPVTKAHMSMGQKCMEIMPDADICYIPANLDFMSDWKEICSDEVFNDQSRFALLEMAIKETFGQGEAVTISDIECRKITDGRTYNSILYFKKIYTEVYWCMGADKVGEITEWYMPEKIIEEARIILFTRDDIECLENDYYLKHKDRFVVINDNNMKGISSTQIRVAYKEDRLQSVASMIPESVYDYLCAFKKS